MKLTFDNYKDILNKFNTFNEHDIGLVESLLKDAYEYTTNGRFPDILEIHIDGDHTDWSPERVEPCPDYYGTFSIKWACHNDTINDGLILADLDDNMCTLCQAFEQLKK